MRGWKKAVAVIAGLLAAIVVIGLPAMVGIRPFIGPRSRALTARTFDATPERLARGKYLLTSGQPPCVMCHSPLEVTPDGGLTVQPGTEFSGRSFDVEGVPFVVAPNLTPDPETGIGTWTDDQLARAIREGISHDGRALFPIMPYEKFHAMSDEDLAAVIVYLRSLPPVRHELAKTAVPFPLNRLINSVPEPVTAPVSADLSTPEKRGAYIAQMGVCADCHTTRDDKGNVRAEMAFAGGTAMPFGSRKTVYSANLTPGVNGIPYYTEDLFVETIRTGKVRSRKLDSMMPLELYKNMTDQDLKDLFAYLKTLKPVDHYVDNSLPPTFCPKCGLTHGGGERNKKSQ
jgi:mono/diheme cytochrome c family protein